MKRLIQHLQQHREGWLSFGLSTLLFFLVSALYFAPQFSGEVLPQHDVVQYEGMVHDIRECRTQTGEDPQWTGGMFGGMPAYLINVAYPAQLVKNTVGRLVGVMGIPAAFIFFAMLAMWLMLRMMRTKGWVATVAALGYGFSTYFLLIIGAGHITKMWALVYAPLMMGGAWMTLRGNRWWGMALTALFTSLEIGANHPQIAYYFLVAMALMWLSEGVVAWREKLLKDFAKRTLCLVVAGVVALASNFSPLWYTLQHTPDTIRGGSELAAEAEAAASSGLDLDYATAWSYGIDESWNMLIPDLMGGDSMRTFSRDGAVAEALEPYGLSALAQQLPAYWGDQPFTAGPTYIGAVILFLAVMGLFVAGGRDRWWVLAASLVALALAWGSHWIGLTEWAFKWLPGYNKFRTVSMFLVVVQWTMPLMAAVALSALWQGDERDRLRRGWCRATALVAGITLLFAVGGKLLFDFGYASSEREMTEMFGSWFREAGMDEELRMGLDVELGDVVARAMAEERFEMMRSDAWRSLALVLLTSAAVGLTLYGRMKRGYLMAAAALLVLVDLVPVGMRYLSHENFVSAARNRVVPTEADRQIMADKELGYRVLNLTVSPYNDATTSYFHRSVGGYHGAKLARYQDLIDYYLSTQVLHEEVLDMLNTRYVILSPDSVLHRPTANGAAWFVEYTLVADTPAEEYERLGEIDTRRVAVIHREDIDKADHLPWEMTDEVLPFEGDIQLVAYRPNRLRYHYTASEPRVAIFSEIFYDKGWRAYVDGEEYPSFRADYVLRGMQLPAGEHEVEWHFRAPKWGLVEGITLVASLLILGLLIGLAAGWIRQACREEDNADNTTLNQQ